VNEPGRALAYFALFSEIGLVMLVADLAGALGGYWLDQRLGTLPLFVLVGLGIGLTAGALAVWRMINRFLARLDE